MFELNGVRVKPPSALQVKLSDLDGESNRSLMGEMLRDRIAVKRSIEAAWDTLTMGECAAILQAVSPAFFSVRYPDPEKGTETVGTFYVGDRSVPVLAYRGGVAYWKSLQFTLVEK